MPDSAAIIAELRQENERLQRENAMLLHQSSERQQAMRREQRLAAESRMSPGNTPRGTRMESLDRQGQMVSAETIARMGASTAASPMGASSRSPKSDIIELRSDTLTKPDAAMRQAMATAEVGDAVWGTDPTVKALEAQVASMTGKEAALFVPSGVMGNLVLVMCHCDSRSSEVLLGDRCHQLLYETGNLASVAGVQTRSVPTAADGTLDLNALRACFRGVDQHWPTTRAVLLENTHNFAGGKVLPMSYVQEVRAIVDAFNAKEPADRQVALHCDGARAWHAAVALGITIEEVLAPFDTASLCLSKALGAPMGSVIVGPRSTIEGKARRLVKMLGGGMRQTGIVAAGAIHALTHQYARLAEDHARARELYEALKAAGIDAVLPETNIAL
jgi:threonine aldolase